MLSKTDMHSLRDRNRIILFYCARMLEAGVAIVVSLIGESELILVSEVYWVQISHVSWKH